MRNLRNPIAIALPCALALAAAFGSQSSLQAQSVPGVLSRDRTPSQTFFEEGYDQLEQEIRILRRDILSDSSILTIRQDVRLQPYRLENSESQEFEDLNQRDRPTNGNEADPTAPAAP
jgi:hypothetical protein